MQKIAVTGAGGKVGKQVVRELMNKGYEVLAISHRPKDCPAKEIVLDINDYEEIEKALIGYDAVIHLAAIPSPRTKSDSFILTTNTVGAFNVMRAAGENGIKRIALASTDCTLGFTYSVNRPQPDYLPVDEKHPLKSNDSYGLSKLLMERAAQAMVERHPGMSIASLRITHITNPEEYKSKNSIFLKWAKNPEKGPWNLWSYIDNRDAARAFRKAVEIDLDGHEVFFIAADNTRCEMTTQELVEKYYPEVEIKKDLKAHESLENNSKAKESLSFFPKYKWNDK